MKSWKVVSVCVALVAVAGLVGAAQPDFSGNWQAQTPQGQTTLRITQNGDSLHINVEGRGIFAVDQLDLVADGVSRSMGNGTMTAHWEGSSLVIRFEPESQVHRTAYSQKVWTLTGADTLQIVATGAAGKAQLKPHTTVFHRN